MKRQRTLEVRLGVIETQLNRTTICLEQPLLLRELLGQHLTDDLHVDAQKRGQRARIHNIAKQRAIPIALEVLDAHPPEGDAEDGDPFADQVRLEWPRRVVEEVPALPYRCDGLRVRTRIERDDQIHLLGSRRVPVLADANVVERWQPLDVRWEDVFPRDRDAHPKDRLHEQAVCAGRARAVHCGHPEREVVDAAHAIATAGSARESAYGITSSNFFMSHAAVGHRSAHNPQWRQMSSSLTITRFVCGSASET